MADFLDEKRKEIDVRLRELRPLVEEYNRLEKAAAALSGVGGTPRAATARRRGGGGGGNSSRRGRPRGSGNRAKQALELPAREVLDLEALRDLVAPAAYPHREARDQALFHVVGAVGRHRHRAQAVGAEDPVAHVVYGRV